MVIFMFMLAKVTSNNLSSFNVDFILISIRSFSQASFTFPSTPFLVLFIRKCPTVSVSPIIYSYTGHCYTISFVAAERFDVLIIITKTACSVSCLPGKQNVGSEKSFFASGASEIVPHFQDRGTAPAPRSNWKSEKRVQWLR